MNYSCIRLKGLKHHKTHDSGSPGRDLNMGPLEYKAGVLTPLPQRSVGSLYINNNNPWRYSSDEPWPAENCYIVNVLHTV
jgi:hypothetical protein